MKTVRQQILEYLENRRSSTAPEIARVFKMTGANARHHLSILLSEGAIEISGTQNSGKAGRPTQLYSPARQMRRNNLHYLVDAFLTRILPAVNKFEQREWQMQIADYLWEISSAMGEKQTAERNSLSVRLHQTIRHLNRINYDARWEAHAPAPRVILGHCPYASIIDSHPELCQMDAFLLQRGLKISVTQEIKLAKDSSGLPYCRFVVGVQPKLSNE